MALNPVERFNVFPENLRKKLRERSYSNNLVRTRTPFLRFTTAATMGDLSNKLNIPNKSKFKDYDGYEFFTLGLHGYENVNYSVTDLYGTQSLGGLVIGTTYKQDEQRLVRTFGGLRTEEKAKSYPPPGILSAKVERLRNGNVLKFTVETQCYTQEQLEMLDAVCFVPGMTCVLEWGTQYTTPSGIEKLKTTLDFKNVQAAKNAIIDARLEPRKTFIGKWCAPNNYDYDWAVAHIANIKTRLVDNVYKTTIVAYGKADNIMYISAYATTNALTDGQVSALSTSLHNYFKLNGEFTQFCQQAIANNEIITESEYRNQIITFQAPPNPREQRDTVQTSQPTGLANDFGLEDTYFLTMDFLVHIILNKFVTDIINKGLNGGFTLTRGLIKELKDSQRPYDVAGEDNILVGYNSKLRSTSPEVMIIFNDRARKSRSAQPEVKAAITGSLERDERANIGTALRRDTNQAGTRSVFGAINQLYQYPFGKEVANNTESDLTFLGRGVWINSKAIQSAFLNARTIMEGLETLLRNINAATENYWDLKLYYDDDAQQFRILDDNARKVNFRRDEKIYEFNKPLENDNGNVIGPDVLNIELNTDYPKMFFSQLAVSAINGGTLSGLPQRNDIDFRENTSVKDLFTAGPRSPEVPAAAPPPSLPTQPNTNSFIRSVIEGNNAFSRNVKNQLISDASSFEIAFASGVSGEVATIVRSVFGNPNLLTVAEAEIIKKQLQAALAAGKITQDQSATLTRFFIKRAEAIITQQKAAEEERVVESFRYADTNGIAQFGASKPGRDAIIDKIKESRNQLIAQVRQQGGQVAVTQAQETAERERARSEAIQRASR